MLSLRAKKLWLLGVGLGLTGPVNTVRAEGFLEQSELKGTVYYWQRQRDRRQLAPDSDRYGQYAPNLHHATINGALDFSSGYAADWLGLDLGVYGALELKHSGPAAPNEIGFSDAATRWQEAWQGDRSGLSMYKAALKMQHDGYWLHAGYIQPTGQTLLAPHWSFLPGTYQGVEVGGEIATGENSTLNYAWMWTNRYKAPWYRHFYTFRQADATTTIPYLHSFGVMLTLPDQWTLEAAFGQAAGYMDQYLAKVAKTVSLAGEDLALSYQFYGAHDKEHGGADNPNDVYRGLAWLQAVTLGYRTGPVSWRLEGTWVKARGNQGYFLQRMTPPYASSNGRLDIWWDARSDWNADGEKAVYAAATYNFAHLGVPGLALGASWVYGWDARPSTLPVYDQQRRVTESAWNLDLAYTVQQGPLKETLLKLHYTRYHNHSDLADWSGGFGNLFQDEKDLKLIVIAPFTLLGKRAP